MLPVRVFVLALAACLPAAMLAAQGAASGQSGRRRLLAVLLGISPGTSKSQLSGARAALRRGLRETEGVRE